MSANALGARGAAQCASRSAAIVTVQLRQSRPRGVVVLLGDRDVELAANHHRQRLLGLALDELDVQLGMGEPLDRRQDQRHRGRLEGADAHGPAHVLGVGRQLGLDLLDARKQLAGARHQRAAGVSELEPAPDLAKQLHAGLALELGELLGHRGRRERERLGRPRDRALGGELAQHDEASGIQHQLSVAGTFRLESIACSEAIRA
jgi:hypothetical protein